MDKERDPKPQNNESSKFNEGKFNKKNFKENTEDNLSKNLDMDKEKIRKQLKATKNVEERIKLFSKRMDSY